MVLRVGRGVSLTRAPIGDAEVSVQRMALGDGSNGFGNSGHSTWLGSDGSSGGDARVAVPSGHGDSQKLRGLASQADGAVGLRVGARVRLAVAEPAVVAPSKRRDGCANRLGSVGGGAARASGAALDQLLTRVRVTACLISLLPMQCNQSVSAVVFGQR